MWVIWDSLKDRLVQDRMISPLKVLVLFTDYGLYKCPSVPLVNKSQNKLTQPSGQLGFIFTYG